MSVMSIVDDYCDDEYDEFDENVAMQENIIFTCLYNRIKGF